MWKKTFLAVSTILVASSVLGFPASMDVVDRKATEDDPAEFRVEVTNNFSQAKSFSLSVSSPKHSWIYLERPRTVPAGEESTLSMYVRPPEDAIQRNIGFDLTVATNTGKSKIFRDYFTVDHENDIEILSAIREKEEFSPGETISLKVSLLNTAPEVADNYSIHFISKDFQVRKKGPSIGSGQRKTLKMRAKLPEKASPGERGYEVFLTRNGKRGDEATGNYTVKEIRRIDRSASGKDRLFFSSRSVKIQNRGNTVEKVEVNGSMPSYVRPIASFNPSPDSFSGDGKIRFTWSRNLEPNESFKASYSVNYWIPLAILAVLLSILLFASRMRQKLEFTKKAIREGDQVKVHIEIENRSKHSLHHVEIMDFVPDIASVNEDFPFAKPVIRKTGNGTRLNWEIEELEPGDQRVFEYYLKPRVKVEGAVELPGAEIEAENEKIAETGEADAKFDPGET